MGLLVLGALGAPAAEAADLTAVHLRANALVDPLGIDDTTPDLSWEAKGKGHDLTQAAYQIRAASSEALLRSGRPDLWDSGKVRSSRTEGVPYAGTALGSRARAVWQVRLWEDGRYPSDWSKPASFETGLLAATDWSATWIGNREWDKPLAQPIPLPAAVDSRYVELKVVDLGRPGEPLDDPNWKPRMEVAEVVVSDSARPGQNLALGAAVSASEATTVAGQWEPRFLTDGKLTSRDAPFGYRSENHPETDVQDQPIVLRLDLGSVQHFDSIKIYPLWDAPSEFGITPNFPREVNVSTADTPEGPYTVRASKVKFNRGVSNLHEAPAGLPLFAKPFAIDGKVTKARLYVTGLGVHETSINGRPVTSAVLEPPNTDFAEHVNYATYDVIGLLARGANVIGAELGNGIFNVFNTPDTPTRYVKATTGFGPPRLLAQLELTYGDGRRQVVSSDTSWKTDLGATTGTNWYGGEDYDARREQPGWNAPGADLSAWQDAAPSAPPSPQTKLTGRVAPPIEPVETLPAKAVSSPSPGVYVFDFGVNFAGWQELDLRGPAGTKVQMWPAERLNANGTADQRTTGTPIFDTYTLRGSGTETWHPKFVYHGFRYLEVRGLPAAPSAADARGIVLRTANESAGSFSSSNALLGDIHRIIDRAIQSNMYSVFTDCPHREKLGWLEQDSLVFGSVARNYDVGAYYRKLLADVARAQRPDGMIPTTAPEYSLFAGAFRHDANWGATVVLAPWELYRSYGDTTTLAASYPTMQRYLDYLSSKATGYVLFGGLGDWITPEPIPAEMTATFAYRKVAATLAQIASLLGKPADAARYSDLAANIGAAFNTRFVNPQTNNYGSNVQAANALALDLGIVPPARKAAVLDNLVAAIKARGNHLYVGEIALPSVFRVLRAAGRDDVIYDIATLTTGPSYGAQVLGGSTSLGEAWGGMSTNASQNHFMLGAIDEWFTAGLGGIEQAPDSTGYRELVIAPAVVGDLTNASAAYRTAQGEVSTKWTRDARTLTLDVAIPANTTATVKVPLAVVGGRRAQLTASGEARLRSVDDRFAVYTITSGKWTFKAKRPKR